MAKKQETHETIVREAAAAIRAHGYQGVSVADIMKRAGLTHGGFYAHFASRDAMCTEAIERAGAESIERLRRAAAEAPRGGAVDAMVEAYLSDRHVAEAARGCAIVAVGTETARQAPEVRRAATRGVRAMAEVFAEQGATDDEALGILSCMIGAMVLARMVDDPMLGTAIRTSAQDLIRRRPRRGKKAAG